MNESISRTRGRRGSAGLTAIEVAIAITVIALLVAIATAYLRSTWKRQQQLALEAPGDYFEVSYHPLQSAFFPGQPVEIECTIMNKTKHQLILPINELSFMVGLDAVPFVDTSMIRSGQTTIPLTRHMMKLQYTSQSIIATVDTPDGLTLSKSTDLPEEFHPKDGADWFLLTVPPKGIGAATLTIRIPAPRVHERPSNMKSHRRGQWIPGKYTVRVHIKNTVYRPERSAFQGPSNPILIHSDPLSFQVLPMPSFRIR